LTKSENRLAISKLGLSVSIQIKSEYFKYKLALLAQYSTHPLIL